MTRALPGRDDFPFVGSVGTRSTDIDHNAHVGNVALAAYYQEARAAFHRWLWGDDILTADRAWRVFIARVAIDFHAPIAYPGDVGTGQGILRLGRTSFTELGAIFAPVSGECAGTCLTTMVYIEGGEPTEIPHALRDSLAGAAMRDGEWRGWS